MAITDLLSRIPIPPALQRSEAARTDARTAEADTAWMADAWAGYSSPDEYAATAPVRRTRRGTELPSWAILALTSLGLTCLALAALLLLANRPVGTSPSATAALEAVPASEVVATGAAGGGPAPVEAAAAPPAANDGPQSTFTADPTSVSLDVITRLEAASNEPLHAELTLLLDAIQYGFGSQSAQIDPALRSYTTRMASRFEWNPDTFQIAVSAPSAELAEARARTLRRVFSDAVGTGRLTVRSSTGPDAITLDPL